MSKEFFPPRPESKPTIYAYQDTNPQFKGLLKVGYTTVVLKERLKKECSQSVTNCHRLKL